MMRNSAPSSATMMPGGHSSSISCRTAGESATSAGSWFSYVMWHADIVGRRAPADEPAGDPADADEPAGAPLGEGGGLGGGMAAACGMLLADCWRPGLKL